MPRRHHLFPCRPANVLSIATVSPLPQAQQGSAYSFQMAATGGVPPYTWSLVSSTGSNSWSVSAAGVVTSTPSTAETDTLTIKVTDSVLTPKQGVFSLTVAALGAQDVFPAGTGPDGYVFLGKTVADPYAGYSTWYVDKSVGVDPTPGSHQLAGYIYATYQAAVNDALYAGAPIGTGRRVIIRQNAAWNGGSSTPYVYALTGGPANTYKPPANASGTVALPYVVQGDPSVNALATYDGGGPNTPQAAAQTPTVGFWLWGNGGNQNWVIRKIKWQNAVNDFVSVQNSTGNSNIVVEYCAGTVINYDTTGSGGLGMYYNNHGGQVGPVTFRYCSVYNMSAYVGGTNSAAVTSYGQDNLSVYNCYFAYCHASVRTKIENVVGVTTSNWIIKNNIFSNNSRAVWNGNQATPSPAGPAAVAGPVSGWRVTNNLFYGNNYHGLSHLPVSSEDGGARTPYGTDMLFASNTVAETCPFGFEWCCVTTDVSGNGLQLRDNVLLNTGVPNNFHFIQFGRTSWTVPGNTTTSAIKASYIDYNVYGPVQNAQPWAINIAGIAFANFGAWQSAYTSNPANAPDLATLTQPNHNPDPNGTYIPNLGGGFNTVAANYPNAATFNYTPGPGSPLLAASSTGGTVGAIMNTVNDDGSFGIGPGWFY